MSLNNFSYKMIETKYVLLDELYQYYKGLKSKKWLIGQFVDKDVLKKGKEYVIMNIREDGIPLFELNNKITA